MLVDKYIFYYDAANHAAARRIDIERPLRKHELFCLYILKRHLEASVRSINNRARKNRYSISPMAIYRAMDFLVSEGLVERNNARFRISGKGREFLSNIRNYLQNKRLYY